MRKEASFRRHQSTYDNQITLLLSETSEML